MPLPLTRPIVARQSEFQQGALLRDDGGSTALTLPPSHGVALPFGEGVLHTVKDPTHVVPTRSKVVPAGVT